MAEMRRCAGSVKFGIEPHEAPVEDFPKQASQKDGLGRMCRVHWNEYTTALRKAALERKAAEGEGVTAKVAGEAASEAQAEVAGVSQPNDVTATTIEDAPRQGKGARGHRRAKEAGDVTQDGTTS